MRDPAAHEEELRDKMTEQVQRDEQLLSEMLGERGLDEVKLSREEQLARYLEVRNDENWWAQMLAAAEQGGHISMPELLHYALTFERRIRDIEDIKQESLVDQLQNARSLIEGILPSGERTSAETPGRGEPPR